LYILSCIGWLRIYSRLRYVGIARTNGMASTNQLTTADPTVHL